MRSAMVFGRIACAVVLVGFSGTVGLAQPTAIEGKGTPGKKYDAKPCKIIGVGGPDVMWVYSNDGQQSSSDEMLNTFGVFVLPAGGTPGTAKYWWRGKGPSSNPSVQHQESLNYVGVVAIPDGSANARPIEHAWLYELKDSGGASGGWLAFGQDKLKIPGFERYPLYMTANYNPTGTTTYVRWFTYSGTERK